MCPRMFSPLEWEFGRKCKLMMDLLAVHKLDHDFDDAKPWVRLFESHEDPTVPAAEWLDAGWTDPGWIDIFSGHERDDVRATFEALDLNLDRLLASEPEDVWRYLMIELEHVEDEALDETFASLCESEFNYDPAWLRNSVEEA